MFKVNRTKTEGQILAWIYDNPTYARHVNEVAEKVADSIRGGINRSDSAGQHLADSVSVIDGTADNLAMVVVSGDHPSTDGRPVANQLSVAYLHNFGTETTEGVHFMQRGIETAESHGFSRRG